MNKDHVRQVMAGVAAVGGEPDGIHITQEPDDSGYRVTLTHGDRKSYYRVSSEVTVTPVAAAFGEQW